MTQGTGITANTHSYSYKDDSDGSSGTLGLGMALHSETVSYGSGFTRIITRHQEDAHLRPSGLTVAPSVGANDMSTAYHYDSATARLQHVHSSFPLPGTVANSDFTYGYQDGSNLLETVTSPAHTVTNTWEPNRNVLDAKENEQIGGGNVSTFDYSVNAIGQRDNVQRSSDIPVVGTTSSTAWSYDSLGQVTSANDSTTAADRPRV